MENLYHEILFECCTFRHKSVAGQMRFWHIHRHNCYPHGCELDGGHHIPKLLVSEEKYEDFLKEFKKFHRWAKKMKSRHKVSFVGIIDRVYPSFSVSMVDSSPIFDFSGFVLEFKEGMIHDDYLNDPFYVQVNKHVVEDFHLIKGDTVMGSGRFHIDQRGIITIDKTSRLRLIDSLLPRSVEDLYMHNNLSLRIIDYFYQDLCIECPHRILAAGGINGSGRRGNIFVCTHDACVYKQKDDLKSTDSYMKSCSSSYYRLDDYTSDNEDIPANTFKGLNI